MILLNAKFGQNESAFIKCRTISWPSRNLFELVNFEVYLKILLRSNGRSVFAQLFVRDIAFDRIIVNVPIFCFSNVEVPQFSEMTPGTDGINLKINFWGVLSKRKLGVVSKENGEINYFSDHKSRWTRQNKPGVGTYDTPWKPSCSGCGFIQVVESTEVATAEEHVRIPYRR